MSRAVRKFECQACYEYHDTETSARFCCALEVVYVCGACGALADTDQEAALCCLGDCPKCGRFFDVTDVDAECDLGFEPVFRCTQCGWRTGDVIPATAEDLEQNGQVRIVE